MLKMLPKSPSFLIATGRCTEAKAMAVRHGLTLPDGPPGLLVGGTLGSLGIGHP